MIRGLKEIGRAHRLLERCVRRARATQGTAAFLRHMIAEIEIRHRDALTDRQAMVLDDIEEEMDHPTSMTGETGDTRHARRYRRRAPATLEEARMT